MQYQFSTNERGEQSVVVAGGFGIRVIDGSTPSFDAIAAGLRSGEMDEATLVRLSEPGMGIADEFNKVSTRVQYRDGAIFFDGDRIDNALTKHLVAKLYNGDRDWTNLIKFMEKLAANPNESARQTLYNWVQKHGAVINPDGDLVGYKGVRHDGTSVHSGYGIVDGKVYNNDHLPHEVGSLIEYPRSWVDESSTACSVGLHVGTYEYASGFGGPGSRLLTVTVSPTDIVGGGAAHDVTFKYRTCRYKVVDLGPEQPYEGTSWGYYDDDSDGPDGDYDDESDDDCDNCGEYDCDGPCDQCGDCLCDGHEDEDESDDESTPVDGATVRVMHNGFTIVATWVAAAEQWQLTHRNIDGKRRLTDDEFIEWVSRDDVTSEPLA